MSLAQVPKALIKIHGGSTERYPGHIFRDCFDKLRVSIIIGAMGQADSEKSEERPTKKPKLNEARLRSALSRSWRIWIMLDHPG